MKKLLRVLLLAGLLLLLNSKARAQENLDDDVKKVAQSGMQFLKINVDARAAGMANIGLTHSGDASNIFINPAGIGFVTSASVFAGYTEWIADMSKQAFAGAVNFGGLGSFGFHIASVSPGDIEGTRASDNQLGYEDTGNVDVSEYVLGLTYAKRLTDRFTFGGTVKYAHEDLSVESKSILGFDIGTLYTPGWNGTQLGMTLRNFSGEFEYIQETMTLPYTFTVGASTDLMQMFGMGLGGGNQWILAVEGSKVRDFSERVHVGTEVILNNLVSIRAGYKFNYDLEGLTLGAGLNYSGINFNYAYRDFGDVFGSTNMISASYSF